MTSFKIKYGSPIILALLLGTAASTTSANPANPEFWGKLAGTESGDRYDIPNGDGGSAFGRYQIIVSNLVNMGYVRPIPEMVGKDITSRSHVVFTEKSKAMGVHNWDDFADGNGPGKLLQDRIAVELAVDMWNGLNTNTKSYVGKTIEGTYISEAALMAGTWFLGPKDMNTWVAGGMNREAMRNHPRLATILKYNKSMGDADGIVDHLLHDRMNQYASTDISEITNGQYTPGQNSEYAEVEAYVECAPEVSEEMQKEGEAYVERVTAAAQSEELGYTPMGDDTFADMSCVDMGFMTGLKTVFDVPSLDDIGQMVRDMACEGIKSVTSNATSGVNEKLRMLADNASVSASGFGPMSSFGINTQATNEVVGVDGVINKGTITQTDPTTGEKIFEGNASVSKKESGVHIGANSVGGFDGLFRK